jgi:hypothetical protein
VPVEQQLTAREQGSDEFRFPFGIQNKAQLSH